MPAYVIAVHLKLAYSNVCRSLKPHRISRKRDICPPPKPWCHECKTPGGLIYIDIKKLAKIDGVCHRIHSDRTQGNGAGFLFSLASITTIGNIMASTDKHLSAGVDNLM